MKLVKQMAHACVMSHDLVASEDFYCRILGLEKVFNFDKPKGRIGFYLATGGRTYIDRKSVV